MKLEEIISEDSKKEKLMDLNKHLNKMVYKLEEIDLDRRYHRWPDVLKIIQYFREGYNQTYNKIKGYEKMRVNLEKMVTGTGVAYKHFPKNVYMLPFIKEPYSVIYPENKWIRILYHLSAHYELKYWLNSNQVELLEPYKKVKELLKDDFTEAYASGEIINLRISGLSLGGKNGSR